MSTLSSIPFLRILEIVILSYFLLLNITYLITSIFSFRLLKQYAARLRSVNVEEILTSADAPPVTLLVPAYNEEKNVVDSVRAFLNLSYPEYEIFVINDGSTDETLALLKAKYNLERRHRAAPGDLPTEPVVATYQSKDYDRLWVIDKSNGGKSDALNAGLNFCRTPLYCGMDADTILEKDALIRIVRVFLEDVNTIAVGGILRVANGCDIRHGQINRVGMAKSALAKFQVIEYLRAFLTGRVVWAAFKGMLLISGAFGVFRRESVMEAGGYASHLNMLPTVGEDMELVVRLHRKCYEENRECQVKFIPDPVAWTEVPENIKGLAAQRDRWHRGMFESLFRHRKMLLNKKYGRVGMLAFPYYFIFELMGPLVELAPGFAEAVAPGGSVPPRLGQRLGIPQEASGYVGRGVGSHHRRECRRYRGTSVYGRISGGHRRRHVCESVSRTGGSVGGERRPLLLQTRHSLRGPLRHRRFTRWW